MNTSIKIISSSSKLHKNSVAKHTLKSCHEHIKMPIRSLTSSLKYNYHKNRSYMNLIKAKKNTINHSLISTHSLVLEVSSNQSNIKSSQQIHF